MKQSFYKQAMLLMLLSLLVSGCSDSPNAEDELKQPVANTSKKILVTVDASQTYQTIDNFGASDAWACQFVGKWPDAKRNAIADLLFSTDTSTSGNPKGIGLSLWRFNIGAGSAQQVGQSGIGDEWRRAESFLQEDGTYDWEKQAGQRWFLQAAKQRGVAQFLAFPNSPPVQITRNGKAYATEGRSNMAPDKYKEYAHYLATIIKGLKDKGIDIDYISPVNEPQWDWSDGGQEGTPFMNEEIFEIVKALNDAFENESLDTKIDIAEAGKIDYLYATEDKPNRGIQIQTFFDTSSPYYIGNLSHVGDVISGHSYFTTSPFSDAAEKRKELAEEIASIPDLKFWMSEYCILGDNHGEIEGAGRNLGIDPALYVARVIHNDLVVAHATAWHWWLGVSPYDYKDGLVYVDKNKTDGNLYESKILWALGNYSRFIRPGAVRIAVHSPDLKVGESSFLISAYIHPDDDQMTIVAVNSGLAPIEMDLKYESLHVESMRPYSTSKDSDLEPGDVIPAGSLVTIPPRSITTLIGK